MDSDLDYRRKLVERYKKDVEPLFRYMSWLEEKRGKQVSSSYDGNELSAHSITFPVYDSTLLGFVKQVQRTTLTDRNYVYVYSRLRMNTVENEREAIRRVTLKDMDVLTAVLSKYILGGMTKGWVWSQAVEEGIFLEILIKFKELFDLWDKTTE